MEGSARGGAGAGEGTSVERSKVSGQGRSRRRWSEEEKARVVRESFGPGKRVGEVARRYGISRWRLSTWRSAARQGEFEVGSSAAPAGFAALEVDSATSPGLMGSVVIESREVTVRLDGAIDASRVAEIASALRGLR